MPRTSGRGSRSQTQRRRGASSTESTPPFAVPINQLPSPLPSPSPSLAATGLAVNQPQHRSTPGIVQPQRSREAERATSTPLISPTPPNQAMPLGGHRLGSSPNPPSTAESQRSMREILAEAAERRMRLAPSESGHS